MLCNNPEELICITAKAKNYKLLFAVFYFISLGNLDLHLSFMYEEGMVNSTFREPIFTIAWVVVNTLLWMVAVTGVLIVLDDSFHSHSLSTTTVKILTVGRVLVIRA
jgi:hypothetical protein